MGNLIFQIGLLVALLTSQVCLGVVSVSMDEQFHFVVHGQGEQLAGLDFQSKSGALVPTGGTSAAPFTFFLSNTPTQITYANLGSSVTIDGSLTLMAGWDPQVATRDVEVMWGDGAVPVRAELTYGPCELCPQPLLDISVNADQRVVLSGVGQQLSEMTFRSASNSLLPLDVAAPFASTLVNTAGEIKLFSPAPVTIDGVVTLGVGWSDHVYTRDIEYEYQIFDAESVGPKRIRASDYDYQIPQFPRMDVRINDDFQIVISGQELPLTRFVISSSSGAIVPEDDAGPFGSLTSNTANRVTFEPLGDRLILDGEVTLGTAWDPTGREDLFISYELLGELRDQAYRLSSTSYPVVAQFIKLGVDPILITLDDQNRFVITGTGQQVSGIEFKSDAGALTKSEQGTAPFPFVLANSANEVTLGILENPAEILGSYTMDFGLTSAEALADISISVGYGSIAVPLGPNIVCATCDLPTVTVSDDRELIFRNFPEKITEIRFTSNEGGLESLDLPDGITLTQASDMEVVINSPDGFGPETLHGLAVSWGVVSDQQVFVSYTFLDGATFGPLPLSLQVPAAIPEPQAALLLLFGSVSLLGLRRRRQG